MTKAFCLFAQKSSARAQLQKFQKLKEKQELYGKKHRVEKLTPSEILEVKKRLELIEHEER